MANLLRRRMTEDRFDDYLIEQSSPDRVERYGDGSTELKWNAIIGVDEVARRCDLDWEMFWFADGWIGLHIPPEIAGSPEIEYSR